ncbi:hypothetical protein CVS40_4865 [Lucilia cuprina]|nr:hypothetical protein CVS40_4865 [Lucilia cuprina]
MPANTNRGVSSSFEGTTAGPGPNITDAISQFNTVDKHCKPFFEGGLLDCLGKIGGFAREYRGLKNDEEKSRALLGMLMTLQHNG